MSRQATENHKGRRLHVKNVTPPVCRRGVVLLATSLTFVTAAAQSSAASPQNKARACNDLADKKGLKDQERKDFLQAASARPQTLVPLPVAK
jgi:hypothetical protein